MKIVGIVLSVWASLSVLGWILIAFAFKGESNRGAPMPSLESIVQGLSLVIALLPAISLAVVFYINHNRPETHRLSAIYFFIPVLVAFISVIAASGMVTLSEAVGVPARAEQRKQSEAEIKARISDLRTRVSNNTASICELVNLDPAATNEEMNRCLEKIEASGDAEKRWTEFSYFLTEPFYRLRSNEFGEEKNLSFQVGEKRQVWFLTTFFQTWLKISNLSDPKAREQLAGFTESITSGEWSNETRATLQTTVIPQIVQHLKLEAKWDDTTFNLPEETYLSEEKSRNARISVSLRVFKNKSTLPRITSEVLRVVRSRLEPQDWRLNSVGTGRDTSGPEIRFAKNDGQTLEIEIGNWQIHDEDNVYRSSDQRPMLLARYRRNSEFKNLISDREPGTKLQYDSNPEDIAKAANYVVDALERSEGLNK
jgi:hypothetical protein